MPKRARFCKRPLANKIRPQNLTQNPYIASSASLIGHRSAGYILPNLARPSLLKIDTQGAELEVLKGATGLLDQIDVIIIEVSFHEFRQGAPEFHDIVIRMAELGYRGYEILEGHYRAADGALAQVDLAFVRIDSPLRTEKAFFTESQAKRYLGVRR